MKVEALTYEKKELQYSFRIGRNIRKISKRVTKAVSILAELQNRNVQQFKQRCHIITVVVSFLVV